MHTRQRFPNVIFGESLRPEGAALAILIMLLFLLFVLLFMMFVAQPAQAQTFDVIHTFTGGKDGGFPSAPPALALAHQVLPEMIVRQPHGPDLIELLRQTLEHLEKPRTCCLMIRN